MFFIFVPLNFQMNLIQSIHPDLSPVNLTMLLSAALILGMSKAGLSGFGLAAVPVMAIIFNYGIIQLID